jgi:hypothetical protein
MTIDPAIVADEVVLDIAETRGRPDPVPAAGGTSEDIRAAFGE